jgi:hypothetical protein
MLQTSLNANFRQALADVSLYVRKKEIPDLEKEENKDLRAAFRFVLNHYEFMAAGVRNGDFDEHLLRDSERGTIIFLYSGCHNHIWNLRKDRPRMTLYEHLEWLNKRWIKPQPRWQQFLEWCRGCPLAGKRVDPHEAP